MSIDRSINSSNPREQITLDIIKESCIKNNIDVEKFMEWFQLATSMGIFQRVGHDMYIFASQNMKLAMIIETEKLKNKKGA